MSRTEDGTPSERYGLFVVLSPSFPCVAIPPFLFQSIVGSMRKIFVR
jgi:hypothetical protein